MKIVFLDASLMPSGNLAWDAVLKLGEVVLYDRTSEDQVLTRARDAQIIATNSIPLHKGHIMELDSLKCICVCSTGYDHIDLEAASQRNITVCNIPGYSTYSVAQSAAALLLHLTMHTAQHDQAVHGGAWSDRNEASFCLAPRYELARKTLGIIGYGAIGRQFASICRSMGMNILAHHTRKERQLEQEGITWTNLEQLLKKSDIVSLHCPLTEETKGIINAETLTFMKPSAYLINTSRGELVAEHDLAAALAGGVIAGAGLDVLSQEPPGRENPLLKAPNCCITPHNAWDTVEARNKLINMTKDTIESFLAGRPINVVHKK